MKKFPRTLHKSNRWLVFSLVMIAALVAMSLTFGNNVSANHPVFVEGNCDSPAPGTVILEEAGTCGDFDGDGRIGTAEDTDGADRIFGTINAAVGPGTGAAAGTGANNNGTITIVASGRFPETIFIGPRAGPPAAELGNLTIQAAPGVSADINAVVQGETSGGNVTRTTQAGFEITSNSNQNRVILRNLTIRNWETGIRMAGGVRVTIENCRLENNLNFGIRLLNSSRLDAENLRIASTGYRVGIGSSVVTNGYGISFEDRSSGSVYHSQITGSFRSAITNFGSNTVTYYEVFLHHNGAGIVGATRNNAP